MAQFVPKKGQVDYTNVRYCPVVNCLVRHDGKFLLVKRSADSPLYPSCWATIDGFLDDEQSIEDKVKEELAEELGLRRENIVRLTRGTPHILEDTGYNKTWFVVPVLAEINTTTFRLNEESESAEWFTASQLRTLQQLPGQLEVIDQFLT